MSKTSRHRADRYASRHEAGSGEVTKVMETHVVVAQFFANAGEALGYSVRSPGRSPVGFSREDEGVIVNRFANQGGALLGSVVLFLEDCQGVAIKGDASIGVRLGVLLEKPTGHLDDGTLDGESSIVHVHVAPSQSTEFTSSRSCRSSDMEKVGELRISIGGGAKQLTYLVDVGRGEIGP